MPGFLAGFGQGVLDYSNQLQQNAYRQALLQLNQQNQQLRAREVLATLAQQKRQQDMQALIGQSLSQPGAVSGSAPQQPPLDMTPMPSGAQLPPVPNATGQMGAPVRASWFGSAGGWQDPSAPASNRQAGGATVGAAPGIALPDRAGLGKMFAVTTPDGRTFDLPQTD